MDSNVSSFGDACFMECNRLDNFIITKNIDNIQLNTFENYSGSKITVLARPTITIDNNIFDKVELGTIYPQVVEGKSPSHDMGRN